MKNKIESNGERPNVKLDDGILKFEIGDISTMLRYVFALSFAKSNHSILDIGCGYGHGVLLESLYAKKVVGVDVSKDALKVARRIKSNYKLKDVSFIEGIDRVKNKYDIITAFEIIEHIDKTDGFKLLKKAKASLKHSGILFISTPYIDLRGKTYWMYHKHEYYGLELYFILKKHFKYVHTYYNTGEGFVISKGFISLLFSNPLTSNSSLIYVCTNDDNRLVKKHKDHNNIYLLIRGLYRNIRYLFYRND